MTLAPYNHSRIFEPDSLDFMQQSLGPFSKKPSTPERSVALRADPKMREMVHFLKSREHENRLVHAADLRKHEKGGRPDSALKMARFLRETQATFDNDPTYFRSTDLVNARLQWRESMDKNLRRLIKDTDMVLDQKVSPTAIHKFRCSQLDKTYDWYERSGLKEVKKERPPPHFLRFDAESATMPGSTRPSPQVKSVPKLICSRVPVVEPQHSTLPETVAEEPVAQAEHVDTLRLPIPPIPSATSSPSHSPVSFTSPASEARRYLPKNPTSPPVGGGKGFASSVARGLL